MQATTTRCVAHLEALNRKLIVTDDFRPRLLHAHGYSCDPAIKALAFPPKLDSSSLAEIESFFRHQFELLASGMVVSHVEKVNSVCRNSAVESRPAAVELGSPRECVVCS